MSTRARPSRVSDRLLVVLAGGLIGVLFSCCVGAALLALLARTPAESSNQPPSAAYDIEAVVGEACINRMMLDGSVSIPSPLPMVAGHLDILPGGRARFMSQMELGPLQPVVEGTIRLAASETGSLEISLVDARVGYLPLTPLVPKGQFDTVNAEISRMLEQGVGPVKLQVVAVTSDETSLHVYLATSP
ncbi:MAG: hypothetical protein GX601_00665 [Anaerolineales bacterium]|nr:hypothetical protein [Anaerolineales bacterium]